MVEQTEKQVAAAMAMWHPGRALPEDRSSAVVLTSGADRGCRVLCIIS